MSQKLHLNAGVLRIHGLDIKLLGANDLDLLVIHIVILDIHPAEASCRLFPVHYLGLIFLQLSFNDLLHQVNGNIHIIADLLGTDNIPFHRNGHLYLLALLLNAQGYMHFRIRVKIFLQLADLILYS